MKRIIFDDFARHWIIWGALCLLCFVVGLSSVYIENNHMWVILFSPVWLTSFLNQNDQRLGNLRAMLVLPFTTRQIGRVFWWLRVGLPALLIALVGGLGILLHASFANQWAGAFEAWLRMVLVGGLTYGSLFWLFSGTPSRSPNAGQNRFLGQLYSYGFTIVLIGGGYLLYKSAISLEAKLAILCFFGLIFSILGWFRAEGLVVDYGAYRQGFADSNKPRRTFKPQTGYGGIPYMIMRSCVRFLGMLFVMMAFVVGLSVWHNHRFDGHDFLGFMSGFRFYLFLFCLFAVPISSDPKFLRSLPLTSKQLAAIILCLPTVFFLIVCGILVPIDLLTIGAPNGLSLLKAELLCLAPICVLTTAIVWRDERMFAKIVLVVTVFVLSAFPAIYQLTTGVWNDGKQDMPIGVIIAVPSITWLLAFFTISWLLEKNDMTYRVRLEAITGFNGPTW